MPWKHQPSRCSPGAKGIKPMGTDDPVVGQRLSGVDAAFLYLERKEIPLHIAGVMLFDGEIPVDEFARSVESRLDVVPTYRKIVVEPPCNAGYPTWEDDPCFDIHRHIHAAHLDAPGGDAELEELAGRLLSQVMDRGKPLWDIHVVDGLTRGRGALILRVHHALADGIGGAALVKMILDPTPEGVAAPGKRPRRTPLAPAAPPSAAAAIASGLRASLEHLIDAEAAALEIAHSVLSEPGTLEALVGLLPELLGAVERLPFNKPCSGDRKFCWTEVDFSEVQAIRAVVGGSVNDVVLTVLVRAISRYVELHGETVANRMIRVVCPVNLRQDNGESMGNQISFLPVVLPMDLEDPVRMLEAVSTRTAIMKKARAADFVALVANWLGIAPPAVQEMMWKGISQVMLPLPLFNIICTNLPGSPQPLYCMGRRMLALYPQVPTGYDLGINCAVHTYCGKLFFGLIADAHIAEDVARLRDLLGECFSQLCRAAGVGKAPRPPRVRKARARRPKVAPPAAEATPSEPAPEPATVGAEAGES